jgi:hypothetical protein
MFQNTNQFLCTQKCNEDKKCRNDILTKRFGFLHFIGSPVPRFGANKSTLNEKICVEKNEGFLLMKNNNFEPQEPCDILTYLWVLGHKAALLV